MKRWIPRKGDEKIQEASATLALINFDPNRVDELTISELNVLIEGVTAIVPRVINQLKVRTVKLVGEMTQDPENIGAALRAFGALLDEKAILQVFKEYAPKDR